MTFWKPVLWAIVPFTIIAPERENNLETTLFAFQDFRFPQKIEHFSLLILVLNSMMPVCATCGIFEA
jgi:hypothetical protein